MKSRRDNIKKSYTVKTKDENEKSGTYGVMLKSLIICFSISFVMILIYALILSISSFSDASMSKVTQTILIISVAIASAYGGKKTRHRGWMFGSVLGLIFSILLIPFGMAIGQDFAIDIFLITKMLVTAAVGAIGGIIGVNLN